MTRGVSPSGTVVHGNYIGRIRRDAAMGNTTGITFKTKLLLIGGVSKDTGNLISGNSGSVFIPIHRAALTIRSLSVVAQHDWHDHTVRDRLATAAMAWKSRIPLSRDRRFQRQGCQRHRLQRRRGVLVNLGAQLDLEQSDFSNGASDRNIRLGCSLDTPTITWPSFRRFITIPVRWPTKSARLRMNVATATATTGRPRDGLPWRLWSFTTAADGTFHGQVQALGPRGSETRNHRTDRTGRERLEHVAVFEALSQYK